MGVKGSSGVSGFSNRKGEGCGFGVYQGTGGQVFWFSKGQGEVEAPKKKVVIAIIINYYTLTKT